MFAVVKGEATLRTSERGEREFWVVRICELIVADVFLLHFENSVSTELPLPVFAYHCASPLPSIASKLARTRTRVHSSGPANLSCSGDQQTVRVRSGTSSGGDPLVHILRSRWERDDAESKREVIRKKL